VLSKITNQFINEPFCLASQTGLLYVPPPVPSCGARAALSLRLTPAFCSLTLLTQLPFSLDPSRCHKIVELQQANWSRWERDASRCSKCRSIRCVRVRSKGYREGHTFFFASSCASLSSSVDFCSNEPHK
jgi:hypothetical protein